ncbi:Gfo/Idh/MocA family oxidoreductase [Microbacterium sp. B2969]|uniref:Gfo/Idh/MocA family oxidoreductase n=1 Tax=Microbacterium alkaliflavum TaxID=3248839 RepID=A0ABW7Q9R5_9MICO
MTRGVGIVGAGPGVAALHLPTLARLPEHFRVVHVSDAGSGRAAELAARSGAASSSGIDALLADPAVEVVALCGPPATHAAHMHAAVAAGVGAIFCEKPLATTVEEAEEVVELCRAHGVALLVGTNHHFDPAWGRATHHVIAHGAVVRAATVTLALPPNGRYHDVVTQLAEAATMPGRARPDLADPEVAASVVRQLVVGLAVHDLPILRDLAPDFERAVFARPVAPIGYAVGYVASGIPIHLTTVMLPDGADALWRIEIATDDARLDVAFPPAFVHAGSAMVTVRRGDGRTTTYPLVAEDGYLAEWRAFAALLDGRAVVEYDEVLADARYGLALADAAAELVKDAS